MAAPQASLVSVFSTHLWVMAAKAVTDLTSTLRNVFSISKEQIIDQGVLNLLNSHQRLAIQNALIIPNDLPDGDIAHVQRVIAQPGALVDSAVSAGIQSGTGPFCGLDTLLACIFSDFLMSDLLVGW